MASKAFRGFSSGATGQVQLVFNEWRGLPDVKLLAGKRRFLKLMKRLKVYSHRWALEPTLSVLKADRLEGEKAKRAAVIQLMKKTMSGSTRCFRRWVQDMA
jgi:hypothetical protein